MRNTARFSIPLSIFAAVPALLAQPPAAKPDAKFVLTVDIIMRGPDRGGRWDQARKRLRFAERARPEGRAPRATPGEK